MPIGQILQALLLSSAASVTTAVLAEPRPVELTAMDYRFEPPFLAASPGELLHLTLHNEGKLPHGLVFELPTGERGLRRPIVTGETSAMTLFAPLTPGSYDFYCPMDGHRALGMSGTLVVTARITR